MTPEKTEAILRVVEPLLEAPVANRPNWAIPRLTEEVRKKEWITVSRSAMSRALRKNFSFRRPKINWGTHAEGTSGCRGDRLRWLADQTFDNPEELDRAIHDAVEKLNIERVVDDELVKLRMPA